jgi:hypothetical protein
MGALDGCHIQKCGAVDELWLLAGQHKNFRDQGVRKERAPSGSTTFTATLIIAVQRRSHGRAYLALETTPPRVVPAAGGARRWLKR